MNAAEVERAILRRYHCEFYDGIASEWAALPEVSFGGPTIDLFLQRAWRGRPGQVRHAIEIKVSRSDFRKELSQPLKRRPWVETCHQFWFATPAGLLLPDEIPEECGLYEVHEVGDYTTVKVAKRAPTRKEPRDLPAGAVVELARRESKLRERARNEARDNEGAHIPTLKAELATARQAEATADSKRRKAEERAKELLRLVAPMVDVPCECGTKIKLTNRGRRNGGIRYEHDGLPGQIPVIAWRTGEVEGYYPCHGAKPDLDAVRVALFPHLADEPES